MSVVIYRHTLQEWSFSHLLGCNRLYIHSEEYLKFGKLLINKAKYFVAFYFLLKLQFTLPEYMLSPV